MNELTQDNLPEHLRFGKHVYVGFKRARPRQWQWIFIFTIAVLTGDMGCGSANLDQDATTRRQLDEFFGRIAPNKVPLGLAFECISENNSFYQGKLDSRQLGRYWVQHNGSSEEVVNIRLDHLLKDTEFPEALKRATIRVSNPVYGFTLKNRKDGSAGYDLGEINPEQAFSGAGHWLRMFLRCPVSLVNFYDLASSEELEFVEFTNLVESEPAVRVKASVKTVSPEMNIKELEYVFSSKSGFLLDLVLGISDGSMVKNSFTYRSETEPVVETLTRTSWDQKVNKWIVVEQIMFHEFAFQENKPLDDFRLTKFGFPEPPGASMRQAFGARFYGFVLLSILVVGMIWYRSKIQAFFGMSG